MQSVKNVAVFPDFTGNSRAWKPNKAQTKRENITGVQYLHRLWYYTVINKSGVNICMIIYLLLIKLPHYLRQLPLSPPPLSPPPTEYATHLVWDGMQKHTTTLPPELITRPIRLWQCTLLLPTSPPTTAPPGMHP